MKHFLASIVFATSILVSATAFAAEQTIKLSVPGMTCASCPYIVKASIEMVDGIISVEATMEDLSATVVYDDAITNIDEIREATAGVGYPSSLFKSASGS